MWKWLCATLAVATAMSGCAGLGRSNADRDMQTLSAWMEGSFSSAEQAAADPDYRDIRLHIARIWKDQHDGTWFYVEQAVAGKPPYRQRVYHLTASRGRHAEGTLRFVSEVYLLPGDAHRFDGAWQDERKLAGVTPNDLASRDGCAVILFRRDDQTFAGSTQGTGCASDLAGAKYATSKVRITSDALESWDQGFNEKDEQVWGATKGPYLFKKQQK